MAGLLDALQAASNSAASNVSGPVDAIAWLLRKAGIPVPEQPIGGSDWMQQQGLTLPVQQGAAQVLGETAGLLSPVATAARAPQVAGGLLSMIENAAAPPLRGLRARELGAVPVMTEAERDAAMRLANYERGWYRGGAPIVDGKKSGDWYTQFADEAADYARRLPSSDVREYAVPIKQTMKFDAAYPAKMAHDLAARVEGMGEKGAKLAKELRSYGPDEHISGLEAWRGLSKWLGEDVAAQTLADIGWRAVKGVNSPNYLRLLPGGTVRDANLAKFDPARLKVDDIFGGADPALLGLLAAAAGGGSAALTRIRGGE